MKHLDGERRGALTVAQRNDAAHRRSAEMTDQPKWLTVADVSGAGRK